MLKMTTSALAITALMTLGAHAQSTDDSAAENAAESAGEAVENTGEAIAQEAGEAADAVEETAEDAAAEVEQEAEEAEAELEAEAAEAAEAEADVEVETVEVETVEEPRMDGDRPMLRTPDFEREGYDVVELDEMTSEDMTGMRIYSSDDEDVGEISELIMSSDGATVERAILDIGGFLGLGEHQIAVTLDELQIMRDGDGTARAYIDATQEELENQPEYEG